MRNICAAVVSVALITSSAFAADTNGVLAAGKPAGVKAAQGSDSTVLFVAGGIALAGIIALSMNNNNNGVGAQQNGASLATTTTTTK